MTGRAVGPKMVGPNDSCHAGAQTPATTPHRVQRACVALLTRSCNRQVVAAVGGIAVYRTAIFQLQ
jgi:hypothetical protein